MRATLRRRTSWRRCGRSCPGRGRTGCAAARCRYESGSFTPMRRERVAQPALDEALGRLRGLPHLADVDAPDCLRGDVEDRARRADSRRARARPSSGRSARDSSSGTRVNSTTAIYTPPCPVAGQTPHRRTRSRRRTCDQWAEHARLSRRRAPGRTRGGRTGAGRRGPPPRRRASPAGRARRRSRRRRRPSPSRRASSAPRR